MTDSKNYVSLKFTVDPMDIIKDAVERGLAGGMSKFLRKGLHNHYQGEKESEYHDFLEEVQERIQECQIEYIMNNIAESLYEEDREE